MTPLKKPVLFLATADSEKSRNFYEQTLSFNCLSDDPFALAFEVGETKLRIQKVEAVPTVNHTVLWWEVVNIQMCVNELSANGVQFEKFPHLQQDEQGIWCAPGGASVAWFKDPDGNTLSLTEY